METYKVTYADIDWDRFNELEQQLSELGINCSKWNNHLQIPMVEVDVTSEDALVVLKDLDIIDQVLYDDIIDNEVQTLFLS